MRCSNSNNFDFVIRYFFLYVTAFDKDEKVRAKIIKNYSFMDLYIVVEIRQFVI